MPPSERTLPTPQEPAHCILEQMVDVVGTYYVLRLVAAGYVLNSKGRARRFRSPLHALCWADGNGYEVGA